MVKLSNKGKSKPTKRKTLKTKYKIERKVRQHKKKLRKQMRKLGNKNIKPRKGEQTNTLPNSFPFKAQILQHFKNQLPAQVNAVNEKLEPSEWGLIALQNRSVYLPKDKDHLTKKYLTVKDKIWTYANVIIETVDARNVALCLNKSIKQQCISKNIHHLVVVCKIDTVSEKKLAEIKKNLASQNYNYCVFSTDQKRRNHLLEQTQNKLKQLSEGLKKCAVVGKSNTGKHTLIKQFMKLAKFHNEDYATINSVQICTNLFMLDTPYKIEDDTGYPLFHLPLPVAEESIGVQEEKAIKYLFVDNLKNRNDFIMHYGIQDFVSIDDLLKKVGKVNRVFGKGGMVNTGEVKTSILTDWYQGKLNYIFE